MCGEAGWHPPSQLQIVATGSDAEEVRSLMLYFLDVPSPVVAIALGLVRVEKLSGGLEAR